MTDELITYDTAVLAKEKGFDLIKTQWITTTHWVLHPITQSLLQRWLREKYILMLEVTFESLGSDEWAYSYIIHYLPEDKKQAKRRVPEMIRHTSFLASGGTYTGAWDTYEQALEAGLQHGLKLLP